MAENTSKDQVAKLELAYGMNDEIRELIKSYEAVLALANIISKTMLIKNNNWIVQVKSIHQHYLYNDENELSEIKSSARCAVEIGKRTEGRGAGISSLYSIYFDTEENHFELINEQVDGKPVTVKPTEKNFVAKIMGFLSK